MGAHSFATWFVMAEAVASALPHHTSCRGCLCREPRHQGFAIEQALLPLPHIDERVFVCYCCDGDGLQLAA